MNEKRKQIIDYFGYEPQRRKLVEEVHELNDEILLFERGIGDIDNIIEEMADISNIMIEFMLEYEITNEEITKIADKKVDRTIERINSGYYKK